MSKIEVNHAPVKSDSVELIGEDLTTALRLESQNLVQTKRLIQKTPVTPLQLHEVFQSVDPVLLPVGANVAVLTDNYGQAALAYATAKPHWNVTGLVNDTKSFMNLQNVATPANLEFDKKPKTGTYDAVLAVGWAHQMFSAAQYNVSGLVQGVQDLLALLETGGQLLIQDFALSEHADRFVVLDLASDEAATALKEFSYNARPHAPKALQGFFIETMPSPRAGIQRFHLPIKWAVEFYHRWRLGITMDAPFELTTLSLEQWGALIEQCGARVNYRAPNTLSRKQTKEITRELRFADEQGNDLPLPASSFTLLVEKIPVETPLQFYERRLSTDKAQDILISGLKNTKTNEKTDIVEIRNHEDDVLPWYRDADGKLHVLLRMNVPRPIINAVPRGTPNLDGRHWAGYLIEPMTTAHIAGNLNQGILVDDVMAQTGLSENAFGKGAVCTEYYPAPDYLVQRVRGILLPLAVNELPKVGNGIADVLADDVFRALSIGLIPDGKLEILLGNLMQLLGIKPEKSSSGEMPDAMRASKISKDRREAKTPRVIKSGEHLMDYLSDSPTDKLRAVRSVFVEDHATDYGRHIGNYTEQDFIVANGLSGNTAVCIPLIRDPVKGMMLSGEARKLPIPDRMGTDEPMTILPSFSLPVSVKNMDEARKFLAKQLGCDMDDLHVMGPSFFVQPQISAERVYPFLLTAPPQSMTYQRWYKPRNVGLQRLIDRHVDKTSAFVEYKWARDTGEFYSGFAPDIANHLKTIANANPAPKPETDQSMQILAQHPAAQFKLT
jgi:hypothetical protein